MDQSDQLKTLGVIAIAIIAIFFIRKNKGSISNVTNNNAPDQNEFNDAFYNNGIVPSNNNLFGGNTPFQSDISVNVNGSGALSYLTNRYIPLFGFVGATAIG